VTPNEKAATFVGWEPNKQCNRQRFRIDYSGAECWDCGKRVGTSEIRPHIAEMPDMSKPENYMRALEGLVERRWLWFIANHADGSIQVKIWRADVSMFAREPARRQAIGTLAIQALATLYDAEHSEEAKQ
jgi:hypothetical protein